MSKAKKAMREAKRAKREAKQGGKVMKYVGVALVVLFILVFLFASIMGY